MTDVYESASREEPLAHDEGLRLPRWLPLLVGLAIGLAVGLSYTWGLNPVQFYNTDPVDLRPEHKETWILLVAAAYRQDGDLDRAFSRLAGLDDPQIGQTVADLTEHYIREGKPATRIRALATLADALGARTDSMLIYLATPESTLLFTPTPIPPPPTDTPTVTPTYTPAPTVTPVPTNTPTRTPTPRPTITRRPTATSPPPFVLDRRERVCLTDYDRARIEIVVQTEEGAGLPAVEIWVTWSGGADRFLTGLKPELGLGYADFDMEPDIVYAVAVGDPDLKVVNGLSTEPCFPGEGDSLLASWRLFVNATSSAFTPTPTATATSSASPTATGTATPTRTSTPTATSTPTPTIFIR